MATKGKKGPVVNLEKKLQPPKAVTRDLFLCWRSPRSGRGNPEVQTNPVWTWLARSKGLSAYQANAWFDGPSSVDVGACFCGTRFGQTRTKLGNKQVLVGGEHEDFYDPDFYIYNDVHVLHRSGKVDSYGYPLDVFPPTDGHSATLAGDRIVIVGNLGYGRQRVVGATPVFQLDLNDFSMSALKVTGTPPGWIHGHTEELVSKGKILLRGGEVLKDVDGKPTFIDNLDDWSLDLGKLRWTRETRRGWQQWDLLRKSGEPNELYELGSAMFWSKGTDAFSKEQFKQDRGAERVPKDPALYENRYSPPMEHKRLPDGDAYPVVHRRSVDGVVVRYIEGSNSVRVTVEGKLPQKALAAILEDARKKLAALERVPYAMKRVQ